MVKTIEGTARAVGQVPTGLQCLVAVARLHRLELDAERLIHEHNVVAELAPGQVSRMAEKCGLTSKVSKLGWERLLALGAAFPAIAALKNGNFVIITGFVPGAEDSLDIGIIDPLADRGGVLKLSRERFEAASTGQIILIKRRFSVFDPEQPFGIKWFIPEIVRQKRLFTEVTLAVLVLHLLGLSVPIFFQIVIDKVLVNQILSTLYVLGIGVLMALLFETVLGYLRSYILLHATTKIDVRVSTKTFSHLLSLPGSFFEKSSAGVLTKHMQQTSTIREFLTGKLFLSLLDASVLFVFLPVLAFYSLKLTLIVLAFSAAICLFVGLLIGPYQRRLRHLYQAEGERQALLVETVHGMQTVKALAVEPQQRQQWDDYAAHAIERHFEVGKISIFARYGSSLLEKLMTVAVVWVGAFAVFDHSMTVGELVAFQMLSSRVSGPLVQLVTLVHEYQEAALSVRMLGEIMNRPPERNHGKGLRPVIHGDIEFSNVSFNYHQAGTPALSDIDLSIKAGSFIGIVGKSGSGKSTLAKLIQTVQTAQNGVLRFDGYDVREIDLGHIRRNMGVVLQDAFLFRGTIWENIALTKPEATMAEIVEASRNAGADEFVQLLPQGYETVLEEGAANLSGGQKQRLAIARALLRNPQILIMDEATSALDPDSEAIVVGNLERFAVGRTTIVISHRLSTIRAADRIIVLDQGKIVGAAPHEELLVSCPIYAQLWSQQSRRAA